MAKSTASAYKDITDPDFLKFDKAAAGKWAAAGKKEAEAEDLRKRLAAAGAMLQNSSSQGDLYNWTQAVAVLQSMLDSATADLTSLQGQAQVSETQRENRGAVLAQSGVNTRAAGAGAAAIESENLLVSNINQELTGRVSQNLVQAEEAKKNIGRQQDAATGRALVLAGQSGYSAGSGTARAMDEASRARYDADRAAIEDLRIGRQNLLMEQGQAAGESANMLAGAIDRTTKDWKEKSTSSLIDVAGSLLKSVEQAGGTGAPGVQAAQEAVGGTLATWSFEAYLDTLDTLTKNSVNKSTWDRMLLEKGSAPANPYEEYGPELSPLTPVAGTSSNLLAAAAVETPDVYTSSLSGNKKKGKLI